MGKLLYSWTFTSTHTQQLSVEPYRRWNDIIILSGVVIASKWKKKARWWKKISLYDHIPLLENIIKHSSTALVLLNTWVSGTIRTCSLCNCVLPVSPGPVQIFPVFDASYSWSYILFFSFFVWSKLASHLQVCFFFFLKEGLQSWLRADCLYSYNTNRRTTGLLPTKPGSGLLWLVWAARAVDWTTSVPVSKRRWWRLFLGLISKVWNLQKWNDRYCSTVLATLPQKISLSEVEEIYWSWSFATSYLNLILLQLCHPFLSYSY